MLLLIPVPLCFLLDKVLYNDNSLFYCKDPYNSLLNDSVIHSSCSLSVGNYYCPCCTNSSKLAYPIVSFQLNTNNSNNFYLDVTAKEYLIPVIFKCFFVN